MKPDPAPTPLEPAAARPLSWGILGAARIAHRALVPAITARGGALAAIGASTLERAEAFARQYAIPEAFAGYQAVLNCDGVEAVYLPLANGLHFGWALACARSGKHCLCEKPLVLTAEEARQLRHAFDLAGCRLMEAFMWRHHPLTNWLTQQAGRGEIGRLRRVRACISGLFDRPDDYRWLDEQGGGSLWDAGCYCVNAMRLFFGEEPSLVSAISHPIRPGARTDRSSAAWLDFGEDRLGTFECSFSSVSDRVVLILTGDEGQLIVEGAFPGFPGRSIVRRCVGEEVTEVIFDQDNSYEGMIDHFTRAARDPSFALSPGEDGLEQAKAMEALAASAAQRGAPQAVEER